MARKRTEAEILRDLHTLSYQYDPESLYMDGEATKAQVRSKLRKLNAAKNKLVKELGRTPTEAEFSA